MKGEHTGHGHKVGYCMGTINGVRRKGPRAGAGAKGAGSMRRIDSPRGKLFSGGVGRGRASETYRRRELRVVMADRTRSSRWACQARAGRGELSWRRLLESEAGDKFGCARDAAGLTPSSGDHVGMRRNARDVAASGEAAVV
jgi:hypothetical protein